MVNPLLPRLLISLAIAGVAAFSAWRAAQALSGGAPDGMRFRPRRGKGAGQAVDDDSPVVVDSDTIARTRDALSGATLDPAAEIFRCADCQSFYAVASVRALADENGARCINCGSMERIPVQVVARQ
jgi:DNA-directed RNA polymerase subunit RPC12/RpoP